MKINNCHMAERRRGDMKGAMNKKRSKRSGFSLVEVLIALTVLAVGILVIAQMQAAAIRGLAFSRHLSTASQIALSMSEFLRSLPYDDTNPTVAPLVDGVSYVDGDGVSVLLDESVGDDNFGNWRYYKEPRDELLQAKVPNSGGQDYYIRWRVMRAGVSGAPPPMGYPIGLPGPGQITIQVQVIWWEKNPPSNPTIKSMSETDIRKNGGTNDGHLVSLTSTRDELF